jgi:spore coat polysaccharide biosynthesis protein SpsF
VAVATTDSPEDTPLVALCEKLGVKVFRGSEEDVLDRFYMTAKEFAPGGILVRLTGDCPLHDPEIISKTVEAFRKNNCDYAANINPPTFPDGLDTEVLGFETLERAWHEASLKSEREHVTLHIRNHPEKFKIHNFTNEKDLSAIRWTLDQKEDLEFVRNVYSRLASKGIFGMNEILELLRKEPEITESNRNIERDEGLRLSLENDEVVK